MGKTAICAQTTIHLPVSSERSHQDPPAPCSDWDGPNDRGNPQNWSLPMKAYHSFQGQNGIVPPGKRLYIAMLGSLLFPIGLFCVLYVMDFYGPPYGASAMGSNNLFRYLLGAAFPLFIVQMYERLAVGWATSLLGFVSLSLMPIPWVFFWCGPRLRARSRYQKSCAGFRKYMIDDRR
ncbi:hypothetical protein EJ03DRAFT_372531 [Teratosphaeria nubilosa]|uniref:MFS general substrate transporter n=1 Tax=Teratosphaeria nubilosa TaxID=161662 RepID=A0A6G1LGJ5_9PEZI|nr:hypothetical protein EJ03DRAFT_372531 [Teratosphaeria nubilosa]